MNPPFSVFTSTSGLALEQLASQKWDGVVDEEFANELRAKFDKLDDHHCSVGLWLVRDLNSDAVLALIRRAYRSKGTATSTMASHLWDRRHERGLMETRPARAGTLEELLRQR